MTESANAGAIRATIDFDANGLEKAVTKAMSGATKTISHTVEKSMAEVQTSVESGFKGLGHKIVGFLGIEDISSGINDLARFVIDIGRETESSLNNFKAVSNATAAEMQKVSSVANALGNDIALPGTSAADAAEAMTELAKAGFSVEESMSAAKGSLQLATAAQTGAAEAAHISAEQINAFNLKAADAGHVADVLANAANESAADITGIADSMQQAGAVTHAAGISFEETAAAVALMANNSIQGSDAGTSLKSMFVALAAPSGKAAALMDKYGINVYTASGHLKSLAGIVETVSKGLEGATDQQKQYALATIFGTDAIRSINVLMSEGADGLREMTKDLGKQGAAAKLAAANSQGLTGALNALQSTGESLAIEIYQKISPALDHWLRGRLDVLPGTIEQISSYLSELTSNLAPAARLIYDFTAAAEPGAVLAFKGALAGVLGVTEALSAVLSPLVHLVEGNGSAFRGVVSAVIAATIAYKVLTAVVTRARAAVASDTWLRARGQIAGLAVSMRTASTAAATFRAAGKGIVSALGGPWGIAITAASIGLGIFAAKQAEARAHADELKESLDQQTGAITKSTRSKIADLLATEGLFDKAKEYGFSLGLVTDAALGNEAALKKIKGEIDAVAAAQSRSTSADVAGAVARHNAASGMYEFYDSLKDSNSELGKARQKVNDHAAAMKTSATAAEASSKAHEGMSTEVHRSADSLEREAASADHAKRAIQGLRDEAIKGLNAQIDFQQASDDLRKQIRGLSKNAIESGKALNIGTQAGRDTYRAFISLANASSKVDGGMQKARQQIYDTIRPMVDSDAQAKHLTNQFFDLKKSAESVPGHVGVEVHASVDQASAAIAGIIKQLAAVPRSVRTDYYVNQVNAINKRSAIPGQASGGPVVGPGTGTSDSVLRRLSNGEHVFTAEEVEAAGGHAGIFAIRRALMHGGLPMVAAEGGGAALVGSLAVTVGTKDDLPEALDQTMFHLRRIQRGGRYND